MAHFIRLFASRESGAASAIFEKIAQSSSAFICVHLWLNHSFCQVTACLV